MLEVDEDSRLGRELIAGGTKYHAHFVPDDELTADMYETACERLNAAGIAQYEISNFARPGIRVAPQFEVLDAPALSGIWRGCAFDAGIGGRADFDAVRFSSSDSLEQYVAGAALSRTEVSEAGALEETFFLGLRLNRGIDLADAARAVRRSGD